MKRIQSYNLRFGKLTNKDMPDILNLLKDIWEWDYLPSIIGNWVNDPKCYTFGAFLDIKLIAIANVRFLTSESVWLEGGRVKVDYQKKGIGIELLNHGLQYAKEHGANNAQYDTANINMGSIALALRCGFKKKYEIPVFYAYFKDHEFSGIKIKEIHGITQLSSNEAFDFAKTVPNGPENYLCTGWAFVPFQKEMLSKLQGSWFKFKNAFILNLNSTLSAEVLENGRLWIIIYGDTRSASELIQGYLFKLKKEGITQNLKEINIFCPKSLLKELEKLGFKRIRQDQQDATPRSVFLFEKKLN